MSLLMEQMALENKIAKLKKEQATLAIKSDMQIITIRAEASPALAFDQIDVDRLTIAVCELGDYIARTKEIDKEITRLAKLL